MLRLPLLLVIAVALPCATGTDLSRPSAFGARQGVARPLKDAKGVIERAVDQRFRVLEKALVKSFAEANARMVASLDAARNTLVDAAVRKAVATIGGSAGDVVAAGTVVGAAVSGPATAVQKCDKLSSSSFAGLQTYREFVAKQKLGGMRKLTCGSEGAHLAAVPCKEMQQLRHPYITVGNPLASGPALLGLPRRICPRVAAPPADDDTTGGRKTVVAAFCGDNEMLLNKMILPTVFPEVETYMIRMGAGDPVVLKANERRSVGGGFTAVGAEKLGDGGVPWQHDSSDEPKSDLAVPDILMCIGYNYNADLTALRAQYEAANKAERKARRDAGSPVRNGPPVTRGEWHFSADAAPVYWGKVMKKPAYHFGVMPFMIGMDMEPYGFGACNDFDVMLTVKLTTPSAKTASIERAHHTPAHTGCPQVLLLTALYTMAHRKMHSFQDLLRPPGWATSAELAAKPHGVVTDPKTGVSTKAKAHFAAFMYSNCGMVSTSVVRMAFFDLLSEYKHVHALGKCRGETNKEAHKAVTWRWSGATNQQAAEKSFYDGAAQTFAAYKFTVAFENTQVHGYVTEKLINPYLGGSVPIYWGAPDLTELGFNTKAFVHCKIKTPDFESWGTREREDHRSGQHVGFECYEKKGSERKACMTDMEAAVAFAKESIRESAQSCIDEIKLLDGDDEAYRAKLAEPLLIGNKLEGTAMDPYGVGRAIRQVMEQSVDYQPPIQAVKNL